MLLTAREETLRRRCIEGREGNPWLAEMLARHGGPDAMVAALMGEQQRMTGAAAGQRDGCREPRGRAPGA